MEEQEYRLTRLTTTSSLTGGKSGGGSPAPSIHLFENPLSGEKLRCRCCLCFRLKTGIAVLAALRAMFNSILLLILVQLQRHGFTFRITFYWHAVEKLMAMEERFRTRCKSGLPTLSEGGCRQLEQTIQALENHMHLQQYLRIIDVYGYLKLFCFLVGLAGGVAGVWTIFRPNKLAAKFFLWSWPANFVLSGVSWIVWWLAMAQLTDHGLGGSDLLPSTFKFFVSSIRLFFLLYFIKVSWSYCIVLKTRDTDASSSRGLRGGDERSATLA